jgi:type I restriction enzyme S subunit
MKNKLLQKKIPNGWSLKQLKELGEFKTSSVDKKIKSGEQTVNLINYMDVYKNKIIDSSINFMSVTAKDSQLFSNQVEKGDVLFTPSSETPDDIGHSAVVTEDLPDTLYSYHLMRFRLSDEFQNKINLHFRAFLFNSRYVLKQFENLSTGITRYTLTKEKFESVDVFFPENINEQKKIAEILSSVDEEIKKIDDLILKTEELKNGLMVELFTKGVGNKKIKKTKIGQIPNDWNIKMLVEIAKVERGKFSHRPRNAPEFYGGNIPFIQTGDVVNSNGRINSYHQTLNEKGLSVSKLFKKGTIVITIAANIGDTGILEFDSCFPDSLIGITCFSEVNSVFLEYYLRTQKNYLNSISTQSAQKNLNLEKLSPLLVPLPSNDEQKKIADILQSIDQKIVMDKKIKEKLNQLKKGLTSDLLSGKVRVKAYGND